MHALAMPADGHWVGRPSVRYWRRGSTGCLTFARRADLARAAGNRGSVPDCSERVISGAVSNPEDVRGYFLGREFRLEGGSREPRRLAITDLPSLPGNARQENA